MDPDGMALFRELADRSPSEREEHYARHQIPAALRAEVESLLRFDSDTLDTLHDRVAAAAKVVLGNLGDPEARRQTTTPTGDATSPHKNPIGSSEIGEGRFPAGTLFGGRYRIVSLLGRGGMGEVYRASDLKLRQPVALKFLPEATARDPRLLARFHDEVRLARQISHPNVCRVYDIGEVDGAAYISMEYIDGEDLASLLRRIGHLPHDKALEIARRLCAGLAAAHDKGVVHRDLKPANVMINGRGQVFITDFGLASSVRELEHTTVRSGTPAYMAPEQLQGREVSIRSDLYALGLVFYEMFTGRCPFDGTRKPRDRPPSLSSVAKGLDPAVARAIERCIELNPRDRPESALAVAASLPGGNPLAEALAAGVTPSPQMVAASHEGAAISVRSALLSLVFVIVGLVAAVVLGSRVSVLRLTPFENPPEVLAQKAREMIAAFGYTATPVDRASTFFRTTNYQRYAERNVPRAEYRAQLARGQFPLIVLWYRQSPQYLLAVNPIAAVQQNNPPLADPGEVLMWIDQEGRLVFFQAVPQQEDYSTRSDRPGDWDSLFAAAGVDRSHFTPVEPQWIPLVTFDDRAAWTGTYAHAPSMPMRIEAASWKGRPVYFRMIGPWTNFQGRRSLPTRGETAGLWVSFALMGIVFAGAGLVAWRNHRLGRGDLQGASRLAAVTLVCSLLGWLMTAHHVPTVEYYRLVLVQVFALLFYFGGVAWVLYMAIEPYARRRWPHGLIAWTRVLAGRIHDPLVGGHVLIGTAFGVGLTIWDTGRSWALLEEGVVALGLDVSVLHGAGWAMTSWLFSFIASVAVVLGLFVLFLLTRVILRRTWVASVVFVALSVAPSILMSSRPLIEAAFQIPAVALYLWILIRLGVLPLIVVAFVENILFTFPLTTDFSAWYSGATLFALATVLVLAIWSFRVALAGRPLLQNEFLETTT
jgi:predicted Ser/Thr protein kinase